MDSSNLGSLRDELPEGPFWVTGKWLKGLLTALIADRAVLDENSGTEEATETGRIFTINGGNGDGVPKGLQKRTWTVIVNGQAAYADFVSSEPRNTPEP